MFQVLSPLYSNLGRNYNKSMKKVPVEWNKGETFLKEPKRIKEQDDCGKADEEYKDNH